MTVFEKEIHREIASDAASVLWNYWDHEHLYVVHENYKHAYVLYDDEKTAFYLLEYKLPIFSFLTSKSLNVMVKVDEQTIKAFNIGIFGVPICTTIIVNETRKDHCRITMNYKFVLSGWKRTLKYFLPKMINKWNKRVWDEDLPIKLRRNKVLRCGFKDFIGMPKKVEERHYDEEIKLDLPVTRHKESPVNLKL